MSIEAETVRAKWYFYSSPGLLAHAKQELHLIPSHVADTVPDQQQALTVIVFAASYIEAFMNELASIGEAVSEYEHEQFRETVNTWVELMDAMEESHLSATDKIALTHLIFMNRAVERGSEPIQSYVVLTQLRNSILHLKAIIADSGPQAPGTMLVTIPNTPRCIGFLEAKKLVSSEGMDWIRQVKTRAVAHWACNTAEATAKLVMESLPEGSELKSRALAFLK